MSQQTIWAEISHLDSATTNIVLDELMRAAIDGGVGTQRCETVACLMSFLSSVNVRGQIFSKIRKVNFTFHCL